MNEELQKRLLEVIDKTGATFSTVTDKMIVEAPELVKEILWYNGIKTGIVVVVMLCLFIVMLCYEKKIWKFGYKYSRNTDGFTPCLAAVFSFLNIIPLFITLINIVSLIKIIVAPRLFLLEYISQLLK